MSKIFNCSAFIGLIIPNLYQISISSVVSAGNFNKDFFVIWSSSQVSTSANGKTTSLKLNNYSRSALASNQKFLFGQIDMQIKLVPGHSAGTVVAFYLPSDEPNRDEIDFEFLGNVIGKPHVLQTNIYGNGFGDRKQKITSWFDPTQDFHTCTVLWNIYQIVFMVDRVPIRTYRNHVEKGVAYPRWQPMQIKLSIWNGKDWATDGGKQKIDWSKAPFTASCRNYKIDACVWNGNPRFCSAASSSNWWNYSKYRSLTPAQRRRLEFVRLHDMVYDYCQDIQRFHGHLHKECSLHQY